MMPGALVGHVQGPNPYPSHPSVLTLRAKLGLHRRCGIKSIKIQNSYRVPHDPSRANGTLISKNVHLESRPDSSPRPNRKFTLDYKMIKFGGSDTDLRI